MWPIRAVNHIVVLGRFSSCGGWLYIRNIPEMHNSSHKPIQHTRWTHFGIKNKDHCGDAVVMGNDCTFKKIPEMHNTSHKPIQHKMNTFWHQDQRSLQTWVQYSYWHFNHISILPAWIQCSSWLSKMNIFSLNLTATISVKIRDKCQHEKTLQKTPCNLNLGKHVLLLLTSFAARYSAVPL